MKTNAEKKPNLTTELHQAALFGDRQQVMALAKNETKFNTQLTSIDDNDNLPLDRACPRGHHDIVKILITAHKKPGNEYIMHNKQNYYPFLSAVRWYLKALDGDIKPGYGRFNTGKNCSKDYMNIIHLLAKEYPEHTTLPDNKGCNALVYAIIHFNKAREENNPDKIEKIKVLIQFLIEIKIPVQKNKIYHEIWKKVATAITAMEKGASITPQNNTPTSAAKPSFFNTQKVNTNNSSSTTNKSVKL